MRWRRFGLLALAALLSAALPSVANAEGKAEREGGGPNGNGVQVSLEVAWPRHMLAPLMEASEFAAPTKFWDVIRAVLQQPCAKSPNDVNVLVKHVAQLLYSDSNSLEGQLLKLAVDLGAYAPSVEQQRRLGEATWKSVRQDNLPSSSKAWVAIGDACGKPLRAVTALEDVEVALEQAAAASAKEPLNCPKDFESSLLLNVLDEDHIHPASGTEEGSFIVALHGVVGSESFVALHQILEENLSAVGGFTYLVRYWLSEEGDNVAASTTLQGYGVTMDVKNTEYLTVDNDGKDSNADHSKQGSQNGIEQINVNDMENLGYQAALHIARSTNVLQTWEDLAFNFPLRAKSLLNIKVPDSIARIASSLRMQLDHQAPDGVFTVNGLVQDIHSESFNVFDLLSRIKDEVALLARASRLPGLESVNTAFLVQAAVLEKSDELNPETENAVEAFESSGVRLNVREGAKGAVIFLNNIEKDRLYSAWSEHVNQLGMPANQHIPVRKNLYTAILTINPAKEIDRIALATAFHFMHQGAPVRFGVVFSGEGLTEEMCGTKCFAGLFTTTIKLVKKATAIQLIETMARSRGALTLDAAIQIFTRVCAGPKRSVGECREIGLKSTNLESVTKTVAKMQTYVSSKGLETPAWTLNGLVFPEMRSFQAKLSQLIFEEQERVAILVREGKVTDKTDVLELVLKISEAIPKYNPFILQGTKASTFVPTDSAGAWQSDIKYFWYDEAFKAQTAPLTLWLHLSEEAVASDTLRAFFQYALTQPEGVRMAIIPRSRASVTAFPKLWRQAGGSVEQLLEALDTHVTDLSLSEEDNRDLGPWFTLADNVERLLPPATGSALVGNGKLLELDMSAGLSESDISLFVNFERKSRTKRIVSLLKKQSVPESFALTLGLTPIVGEYAQTQRASLGLDQIAEQAPDLTVSIPPTAADASHSQLVIEALIDPLAESAPRTVAILKLLCESAGARATVVLAPKGGIEKFPLSSFFTFVAHTGAGVVNPIASFPVLPQEQLLTMKLSTPEPWIVFPRDTDGLDTDNIVIGQEASSRLVQFELKSLLITGHCHDVVSSEPPAGLQLLLRNSLVAGAPVSADTLVMKNLGYFQLQASPGLSYLEIAPGISSELYEIQTSDSIGLRQFISKKSAPSKGGMQGKLMVTRDFSGQVERLLVKKRVGRENDDLLQILETESRQSSSSTEKGKGSSSSSSSAGLAAVVEQAGSMFASFKDSLLGTSTVTHSAPNLAGGNETIHVFSLASGTLYERFLRIMMVSVTKQTSNPVKFWLIENFLSPAFKESIAALGNHYGFEYALVTYKWPHWLRRQSEKQRIIWGYKILFLDVLFPLDVPRIIYIDSDQVVRADIKELWEMNLQGKPYGYTPFCDSRKETLGFQFWRQGYWANHLQGRPYHISALYVVDLKLFRRGMVGDRLRALYDQLSRDPNSLSNLDQDLPNYAQHMVPIHSLPQDWLWCESWCSDASKTTAKTIDLCNNPLHKEPKLDMAKRVIAGELFPQSWIELDNEVKAIMDGVDPDETLSTGSFDVKEEL
eukprot:CAMPEP_0184548524 /NCGR_PEP_ID=MMETSP0199_2-20130426/6252_1 /TAXON_ID=1112570 /ORGANISM="Thraustochytrium sp., Strain LLF1b" /LENGTH=1540 /DNA_ID=CAMNT_0026943139 /DNA_START=159 /DNA_END=4781 /DNA_ORIENTATION=+